jgi:colicin import membrane protein
MIDSVRDEPGKKAALIFTLLVHGLLVAALFLGVQWKRSQPEVMEVELWSPMAQPAKAPPPPPPEPEVRPEPKPLPKVEPKPEPAPPKKPDIVVKQEKKPEQKQVVPPKPEVKKPEAKQPVDRAMQEALEREVRQRREAEMQAHLKAQAEAEQRNAENRRGLDIYIGRIRGKVRGNMVTPPGIQGNPEALVRVTQLPTGEVLSVRIERSSGNPALDAAIERAIMRSSPLPKPDDPSLFKRELEIKYRPFEE